MLTNEIVKSRGIERIVHFHCDHWEMDWWAANRTRESLQPYLEAMDPSRLSAFVRAPVTISLDTNSYTDRMVFGWSGHYDVFRTALAAMRSMDVDIHLHVHHESWTKSDWPERRCPEYMRPIHDYACETQKFDDIRLLKKLAMGRTFLRLENNWGFVHGCWALQGGDPEVCQISNELRLLHSEGCLGDFSFPAGRRHCDPKIKIPYTVDLIDAIRGYDLQAARPLPTDHPNAWDGDRFLIWSCDRKSGWGSSLDYKSTAIRMAIEDTQTAARYLETDVPVIGGTAYIKTHAHSMDQFYWTAGGISPLAYGEKTILGEFRRIADEAGIPYEPKTVNEVVGELR